MLFTGATQASRHRPRRGGTVPLMNAEVQYTAVQHAGAQYAAMEYLDVEYKG
jgi:hypothetical protein